MHRVSESSRTVGSLGRHSSLCFLVAIATLLVFPAVVTAGADPVPLPDEPDGVTWIVVDKAGTPGSVGFTAEAAGAYSVSDEGDSNQIWDPGETLLLRTGSIAHARSFIVPGTAWKETNNEFRLPFTVSSSGSYTFALSLTLNQIVSDLHLTLGPGASRPSYDVINTMSIIESDGGGESVVYLRILSSDARFSTFGEALAEQTWNALIDAIGEIFNAPVALYWSFLNAGFDLLESGADPDATYENTAFQYVPIIHLDANKQYYLSIRTEQWVWAQTLALSGRQLTSAQTDISLEIFHLTPPQPPMIGGLTLTPNPVQRAKTLSASANVVADPDGNVALVNFYRDTNDDGTPQPFELIGHDADGSDGWHWEGIVANGWPVGSNHVMAVAVDEDGLESNVESAMVTVQPCQPPNCDPDCWIGRSRCDDQPSGVAAYFWADVEVPEELFITSLEYRLRVQHDCVEELRLYIVGSNAGTFSPWYLDGIQCLDGDQDDDSANDDDVEFGSGCGGPPPGCVISNPVYRRTDFFNGQPVHGSWFLAADDTAPGNNGYIDCASILIYYDAPGTPDLQVDEIWTEPAQPIAGQDVNLCARIWNVGDGLAWDVDWEYLIDSNVEGDDEHGVLYPNDDREECDSFVFDDAGVYAFEVCVDDDYCLGETNLDNNCLSTIVVVAAPPDAVTDPTPEHEEQLVGVNPTLSWAAAEHATSYDVYLGTDPACDQFRTNVTGLSWSPDTLEYDTTYYWRIDAVNDSATTTGQCWDFSTRCAPSPGDADGDCLVGRCDIEILLDSWECAQPECPDFDGDGWVSVLDLLILLGNWTGGPGCG